MKPCKGCVYISKSKILCGYHNKLITKYDNVYGGQVVQSDSFKFIDIHEMRASDGECGPDRKLYESNISVSIMNTGAVLIMIGIVFGLIVITVNVLEWMFT